MVNLIIKTSEEILYCNDEDFLKKEKYVSLKSLKKYLISISSDTGYIDYVKVHEDLK